MHEHEPPSLSKQLDKITNHVVSKLALGVMVFAVVPTMGWLASNYLSNINGKLDALVLQSANIDRTVATHSVRLEGIERTLVQYNDRLTYLERLERQQKN